MLKFLQKILPNFHSPPPKFSFSLPFQKKLATSFKQQYNPSKLESTQYKLPPSFQSDVENRFVRTWSKLISFPLDEQSFKLKEYKHKKKNQLLLNPEEKLTNTPRESYYEALLYFSTNKDLQNSLRSFNAETIRIDLMFDLLDCLAGLSSFSHCYCLDENHGLRNVVIVTAAVDHINFFKPWLIDKDMRIIAYPSWCGQSVIEIRIDLFQKNVNNEEELVGNAIFLMAARNLKNNKEKFEVPKLSFEGELEKDICIKRYAEGAKNQEIRKINGKNVLDVPPPTVEEIKNMHEVFKLCEKSKNGKDFLYQEETKIYKTLMMYPQNQNLYGTVFFCFYIKFSIIDFSIFFNFFQFFSNKDLWRIYNKRRL